MKTYNPVLGGYIFQAENATTYAPTMTVRGTARKTVLLLMLALLSAGWVWMQVRGGMNLHKVMPYAIAGGIGAFICALITTFKKSWASITAPVYALLEGLVLGAVSILMEVRYPGIAMQAVSLTMATLAIMLFVYATGFIAVTNKFRVGMMAAMGGLALVYGINFILGLFGTSIPFLHSSSPLGIGFSVIVVAIAALSLLLDFDMITQGERNGAPKNLEWYGAFGLMVTLVWLYVEILQLLAKLAESSEKRR